MKSIRIATWICGYVAMGLLATMASAEVIVSTDFTGRTVSGLTATGITWTTNGVTSPGDLTLVHVVEGGDVQTQLFDTVTAQGHFAARNNVGQGGSWKTAINFSVAGGDVTLKTVGLTWQAFTWGGDAITTGTKRSVMWTAKVIGSSSGTIATHSVTSGWVYAEALDLTFDTPLVLTGSETWSVEIWADQRPGTSTACHPGIDALSLNGTVPLSAGTLRWDANGGAASQSDGANNWLNTNTWWDGTANVLWNNTTPNSALIGNGGTGDVITLGVVTADSVGFSDFNGTYTLTNGSLTTLSGISIIGNAGDVTIDTDVHGVGGISMAGSGALTLSGSNTFSGGMDLQSGQFNVYDDANEASFLGDTGSTLTFTGDATLQNSTVAGGQTVTLPQNIAINSGAIAKISGTSYGTTQITGVLSGSGNLELTSLVRPSNVDFLSTSNTFTGSIRVVGADIKLRVNSMADGPGRISLDSQFICANFYYLAGATAPLVFNQRQFELIEDGSPQSATDFNKQPVIENDAAGTNTMTINTDLIVTGTGTKRLVLSGSNTGDNRFAGVITDAIGADVLHLHKNGNGKWILSGDNTYEGDTIVQNGTLVVDGSSCLSDTGALDIRAGTHVTLNTGVKEKVGSLKLNTVLQSDGVWGSTNSVAPNTSSYFSGTGLLYVNTPLPPKGTVLIIR